MSKLLDKLFAMNWANTEKMDQKRIATLPWPDGVKESNNHFYCDDGHKYHCLDVYYPENAEGKLPVIIDVHGGGWMYGDKELNKNYCLYLAKRGYVVVNMSYRLYPEITAIEQLSDVAKAIIWFKDNMSMFPADENNICITGDSAGGMLALYTAMLSKSAKMRELFSVPDFELQFNALGLTSAMSYMNDGTIISVYTKAMLGKGYKKEKWAPYINVDSLLTLGEMIPTFMVTSSGDVLAKNQVVKTAKLFEEKGIDMKLMNWEKTDGEDLPHVFSVIQPCKEPSVKTIDEMLNFFKKYENVSTT